MSPDMTLVAEAESAGTTMNYVRSCSLFLCFMLVLFALAFVLQVRYVFDEEGGEDYFDSARGEDPNDPQEDKVLNTDENWRDEYSEDNIFFDPVDHLLRPVTKPAAYAAKHKLPILLWWTPFADQNNIMRCGEGECYVTEARKFHTHSRTRVFLFYGTMFSAQDVPLPRFAHHEWALYHEESPKNNPVLHHKTTMELFNHTATFRRASDFTLVTQHLASLEDLLLKPKYSLSEKSKAKQASVIYVQSACSCPSDRDAYVAELMKYIQVDSYGACLHNRDLPEEYKNPLTMDEEGFHQIIAKYKFTLSFENAICGDYITEKLWRPLVLGSVPIYKGSPTAQDWMPNDHSIILVDKFKTPADLASYIQWLDSHDGEYLKYLEFKEQGITNKRLVQAMESRDWGDGLDKTNSVTGFECFVCDRVHENLKREAKGLPRKRHVAIQDHYGCPKPELYHYLTNDDAGIRDLWTSEYESSKQESEELNRRVYSHTQT